MALLRTVYRLLIPGQAHARVGGKEEDEADVALAFRAWPAPREFSRARRKEPCPWAFGFLSGQSTADGTVCHSVSDRDLTPSFPMRLAPRVGCGGRGWQLEGVWHIRGSQRCPRRPSQTCLCSALSRGS